MRLPDDWPDDPLSRVAGESLLRRYPNAPEIALGRITYLEHDQWSEVLAFRADQEGGTVVVVHNLTADPVEVRLELPGVGPGLRLVDVDSRSGAEVAEDGTAQLQLGPWVTLKLRLAPSEPPAHAGAGSRLRRSGSGHATRTATGLTCGNTHR